MCKSYDINEKKFKILLERNTFLKKLDKKSQDIIISDEISSSCPKF